MLTLIQFIQLPEQERLSIMEKNVVESNATDQNMRQRLDGKLMSFKQFAQDWLQIITKYADYQLGKDVAVDAKTDASSLHPEPVRDQHQPTGEAHATTRS